MPVRRCGLDQWRRSGYKNNMGIPEINGNHIVIMSVIMNDMVYPYHVYYHIMIMIIVIGIITR